MLISDILISNDQRFSDCKLGVVPEGGGKGDYSPTLGTLSPSVGEKLTILREIFTDEHIYCTN